MAKQLIFGHQNPDTDTIASAIAASYLTNAIAGDDNLSEAVALGKPNAETQFALDHFDVKTPRVITKANTKEVVLVDHNEKAQSVENLDEVKVTSVFDHHKISFESKEPLFFLAQPYGSTATILYYQFQMTGIEIPAPLAGLMASAIISDTLLLKSPTTTTADAPALEDLAKIAGIDNIQAYGMDMLKAGTNIDNQSDQEIVDGDAKSFEMGGKTIRIGQVNTVDIDSVLERQTDLEAVMQQEMADNHYDNFIFVITDIVNSNSKAIVLGDGYSVVEKAFSTKVNNNVINLPGVVSRKKQVVPPLTEAF